MLYTLEQGPAEQMIIKQCMRDGLPLPKRIQNAPELEIGLGFYLGAFYDLDSHRPTGFGVGPIPFNEIRRYGMDLELDEDMIDDLLFHVRALDGAFLEYHKSKNK